MYEFTYQRVEAIAEAQAALAADPQAKLLAGGMTLLPSMKHRLSAPTRLIDIGKLAQLRGVRRDGDYLQIGAGMRHAEVATDALVRSTLPALAELAASIGDPQVRARGTLGGSIVNNDPAADYPAGVLGLDAVVQTNLRDLPAAEFFQGMFTTALTSDEVVTGVRFAIPKRAAYAKFRHPASGYAMTGVLVADYGGAVRVAVTGAGPGVFRWAQAEAALTQKFAAASLADLHYPADDLNADLHAPAAYRAHLIRVLTQQAVADCLAPLNTKEQQT